MYSCLFIAAPKVGIAAFYLKRLMMHASLMHRRCLRFFEKNDLRIFFNAACAAPNRRRRLAVNKCNNQIRVALYMVCLKFFDVHITCSGLHLSIQAQLLKKRYYKSLIKAKERNAKHSLRQIKNIAHEINVLYIVSFLTFWFFCVKTKEHIE